MKYIGIPLGVLFAAILSTTIFNYAAKINFSSVMSAILSRIPGINQFVETDYDTGIYGIIQNDRAEMRSAVYNVDFLMSIYVSPKYEELQSYLDKDAKQYLAIYPYVVEAGIDLKEAKSETAENQIIVNLPSPQVTLTDLDEKRGVTVIRDTKVPSELVNMMKKTFEKRATDLAYEAGIIETAKKNAEKYFTNLFPKDKLSFNFAATPNLFDSVASNKTPIKFVYRNGALDKVAMFTQRHRKIQPDEAKAYFNPADMFLKTNDGKNVNLYYNFDDKSTITDANKLAADVAKSGFEDDYLIKYYDCQQSEPKKIIGRYNLFLHYSHVFFTVGGKQYAFGSEENNIEGQPFYDINGDLLYLAMSSYKQDVNNSMYEEYLRSYDEIRNDISRGVLGSAKFKFDKLKEIKAKNGESELNYAEKDLNSLISFLAQNQCVPTGYDLFDNLLKSAYLFTNNFTNEMTPDFQQMFLANYQDFGIMQSDLNYIIEFFYNLPLTSQEHKDMYRKILIENGYYNDDIYQSLSADDVCNYLINILATFDDELYLQDSRRDNPAMIGHRDILSKTKYSRDNVMSFLKRYGLLSDDGLVVWCVRPEGVSPDLPLFDYKDYPLILFYKYGAMVIPDYTASSPSCYDASYEDIKLAITDGGDYNGIYQFNIGGYKNKGKAICLTLKEIKERKDKYSPTKRWSENLARELRGKINSYCYRPNPFF